MFTTQTLPAPKGLDLLASPARLATPARLALLAADVFARLEQASRRLARQWARERKRRLTERALRQLDSRTLRDIGLTPQEIGSAAAEHAGLVEATRLRAWREVGAGVL